MSFQTDARKRLIQAIDAFLEGSDASMRRGLQVVEDMRFVGAEPTVDSLTLGTFTSMLRDSLYYTDRETLRELRDELTGRAEVMGRAYLRDDFLPEMSPLDRDWYGLLIEVSALLADPARRKEAGVVEAYARTKGLLAGYLASSPRPQQPGEEPIYHLILRQTTHALSTINLESTVRHSFSHLLAEPPYTPIIPNARPSTVPDALQGVLWSQRALGAIAGTDWVLIMWQWLGEYLVFSFL